MNKVISFIHLDKEGPPMGFAQELAQTWAQSGRRILVISKGSLNLPESPEIWVPRLKSLSMTLIQNFFTGPSETYSRISFSQLPPAPLSQEFMAVVSSAFDAVLTEGFDQLSPECAVFLDSVDLILGIARPSSNLERLWSKVHQDLATLHLPQQVAKLVLMRKGLENLMSKYQPLKPLAWISEKQGSSLKRRQDLKCFVQLLETNGAIYRVKEKPQLNHQNIVEQIKNQIQPQLVEALQPNSASNREPPAEEAKVAQEAIEACLAAETEVGGSRDERSLIVTRVLEEVLGLGPLEVLLKDSDVSEIMVNGHGRIFIEKKGKLYPTTTKFISEAQLRTMIDRIVAPIGRRVDESSPLCDARLPDGSRVNIVLPPLALDGPSVTIRKFSANKLDLQDLVRLQSMSAEMAVYLHESVILRQNIVVSGGTGSGKTTLLNALSSVIPEDERIVTIEDAAELKLQKPHVVRLESRPPNAEGQGAIPIRRLVINALRMRPDRIVVGECRGGEALDMLQAMNTGHDGSLTTVHANSPRDALGRLETLVLMAGLDLPVRVVREQIKSAVNLIVQQTRLSNGSRKVTSITEVTGMEGDILTTQEVFRYSNGIFHSTGVQTAQKRRAGE